MKQRSELYEVGFTVIVFRVLNHSRPCLQLGCRGGVLEAVFLAHSLYVSCVFCPHLDLVGDVGPDGSLEVHEHLGYDPEAEAPLPELPEASFQGYVSALPSVLRKKTMDLVIYYEKPELLRLGPGYPEHVIHGVLYKGIQQAGLQFVDEEYSYLSRDHVVADVYPHVGVCHLYQPPLEPSCILWLQPELGIELEHPVIPARPQESCPLRGRVEDHHRYLPLQKLFGHYHG